MLADSHRSPHGAGWCARLELGFTARQDRTVLSHRRHEGPLAVQRPFHPEPDGTCHVYVLHPPGGVASGDELTLELDAAAGSRALITTPAANKLYRAHRAPSRLVQRFRVQAGARLEWLPQETIAFAGAESSLDTRVTLAGDARFVGWEILCFGRPAAGEVFDPGHLTSRFVVERDGEPLFLERGVYAGGAPVMREPWGLSGCPVVGTLVCVTTGADAVVDAVREAAAPLAPGRFSATQLYEAIVCRYVGGQAEEARAALTAAWGVLRARLWDTPPCIPRIWAT